MGQAKQNSLPYLIVEDDAELQRNQQANRPNVASSYANWGAKPRPGTRRPKAADALRPLVARRRRKVGG